MDYLAISKKIRKLRGDLSVKAFADKVGLSARAITYYESNDTDHRPKLESLKKIATSFAVDISYFIEDLRPLKKIDLSGDMYEVPLVSDIAAGFTDLMEEMNDAPILKLPFPECKKAIAFKVSGQSMEPLYYDEDILIVRDRGDQPPRDGHIYVVEWEEGEKIKRAVKYVHIVEGGYLLVSKNRKFKSQPINNIRKLYRIVLEITKFHEQLA